MANFIRVSTTVASCFSISSWEMLVAAMRGCSGLIYKAGSASGLYYKKNSKYHKQAWNLYYNIEKICLRSQKFLQFFIRCLNNKIQENQISYLGIFLSNNGSRIHMEWSSNRSKCNVIQYSWSNRFKVFGKLKWLKRFIRIRWT